MPPLQHYFCHHFGFSTVSYLPVSKVVGVSRFAFTLYPDKLNLRSRPSLCTGSAFTNLIICRCQNPPSGMGNRDLPSSSQLQRVGVAPKSVDFNICGFSYPQGFLEQKSSRIMRACCNAKFEAQNCFTLTMKVVNWLFQHNLWGWD